MKYSKIMGKRQIEVLRLTSQGYLRSEIAAMLHYEEATIKRDRSAIVKRLGARNISHAVALGFKTGVLK